MCVTIIIVNDHFYLTMTRPVLYLTNFLSTFFIRSTSDFQIIEFVIIFLRPTCTSTCTCTCMDHGRAFSTRISETNLTNGAAT